jgi:hypothetical protein
LRGVTARPIDGDGRRAEGAAATEHGGRYALTAHILVKQTWIGSLYSSTTNVAAVLLTKDGMTPFMVAQRSVVGQSSQIDAPTQCYGAPPCTEEDKRVQG